jgi:hypothetical protein
LLARKFASTRRFLGEEAELITILITVKASSMFRSTILALAATAGLIGGTELGGNSARADTIVGVRVGPVGVVVGGPRHVHYRPVYAPGVVYVSAPAPVVVPVYRSYDVYYRGCSAEPWRLFATFGNDFRAREAMGSLQVQGFQVYEGIR